MHNEAKSTVHEYVTATHISFWVIKHIFPKYYVQILYKMSLVMRKPAFCICENKDADQLRGDCEADQHLCFRYTDSTIPLLPKYEISIL